MKKKQTFFEKLKMHVENGDFTAVAKLCENTNGAEEEMACEHLSAMVENRLISQETTAIAQAYSALGTALNNYYFGKYDTKLKAANIMLGAKLLFLYRKATEELYSSYALELIKIMPHISDESMVNNLIVITAEVMRKRDKKISPQS